MRKRVIRGNLPDMIAEAQRHGFTHVLTFGGPVPLREWKPYSHTIPPLEFEMVEQELREKNPGGFQQYTVIGSWPLIKGKLKCSVCRKEIQRGQWTRRTGNSAAHGECC